MYWHTHMWLSIFLFPFSLLYGVVTCVRNKLYDWKCIPSVQYFDIYVISVGNITVGGTGKTPFVEYLVRSLSQDYRVAVLSRGYKRKTKGFHFVDVNSTPDKAGDEPCQIKWKFPDIAVAVDADRIRGIAAIRKKFPDTQIIILDDAFQYRRIKPDLSILLADYNRPLYRDGMLPGGRLREWACFAKRADVMVITKSPAGITHDVQQEMRRRYARIFPNDIFFSAIKYGEPIAMFPNSEKLSTDELKQCDVLLITGIANPKPLEFFLSQNSVSIQTITFSDHHAFSEKDITQMVKRWNGIISTNKLLITTEKDAVRLQQMTIPEEIQKYSYYVPIELRVSDFKFRESDGIVKFFF